MHGGLSRGVAEARAALDARWQGPLQLLAQLELLAEHVGAREVQLVAPPRRLARRVVKLLLQVSALLGPPPGSTLPLGRLALCAYQLLVLLVAARLERAAAALGRAQDLLRLGDAAALRGGLRLRGEQLGLLVNQPAVQRRGLRLHALELRRHRGKLLLKRALLPSKVSVQAGRLRRVRAQRRSEGQVVNERVYAQLQLLVASVRPLQLQRQLVCACSLLRALHLQHRLALRTPAVQLPPLLRLRLRGVRRAVLSEVICGLRRGGGERAVVRKAPPQVDVLGIARYLSAARSGEPGESGFGMVSVRAAAFLSAGRGVTACYMATHCSPTALSVIATRGAMRSCCAGCAGC